MNPAPFDGDLSPAGLTLSGPGPGRCAGVRVRQRLPRHGERRGDGDLHAVAFAQEGGRLVGHLQLPGRHLGGTAVAFSIVNLLPVDLLVSGDSAKGWRWCWRSCSRRSPGTWAPGAIGIPASSSHTLIGAMLGVGLANSLRSRGSAS